MGSERDEDEYAFTVNSATSPEKIDVTVFGVVVAMLIDSGASANEIDKNLWPKLSKTRLSGCRERVIRSFMLMAVSSR